MDTLRGNFADRDGMFDEAAPYDPSEDETGREVPPLAIGQDERRMQVRAYNHWTGLLGNRNFPSIDDLDAENLPDFAPYSVLLDFTAGVENPGIAFLGEKLALECGAREQISELANVPARSLLSRITDHYMQILANQAPIGFEAEFVNQRGQTLLYRGILLPFSSDDDTIDFIYGVINWKELADQQTTDELMLEIDQALEEVPESSPKRIDEAPITDWADGPAAQPLTGSGLPGVIDLGAFGHGETTDAALPQPHFGFDEAAMDALEQPSYPATHIDFPEMPVEEMGLGDLLAIARDFAELARTGEERTRGALYDAISRAYDFACAAAEEPEEFRELVEASGLAVQDRAPMTPVVKLVFGADYDKTRLTEYAAALMHGRRMNVARGMLGDYLRRAEGGLKGVVKAERQLRRDEAGKPSSPVVSPHDRIVKKLRRIAPASFGQIPAQGSEFALVMIRRLASGEVAVLGEIPEDPTLVERAAKKLLG